MSFHCQVRPCTGWAALISYLIVLLASSVGGLQAAPAPEALPEGYGLLLGMPGAGTELAEVALLKAPEALGGAERAPVSWVLADDVRLTSPLRRELHRSEVLPRLSPRCSFEVPQFSAVVRELEEALKFLDFEAAKVWADKVDDAFTCEQEVVSPELLGRFALLQGVLERKLRHTDGGWFLTAVSLHHDEKLLQKQSDAVAGLYAQAEQELPMATRVPATVKLDQAGLEVWIDGVRAAASDIGLTPGAHFIQLAEPGGRVVRGSIETVQSPEAGAPREPLLLPSQQLAVPGTDAVVLRLREAARAGRLDPSLSLALIGLLTQNAHPWLLLLTAEERTEPAKGLWLLPDGSSIPVRLSTGISRLGIVGTTVGAAATVTSGVGLLYFLTPLFSGTPVQNPNDYVAGAVGTGAATFLGAATTAIIVSRTWRIPRSLYRPSQLRSPPSNRSAVRIIGGPGTLAIEVKW